MDKKTVLMTYIKDDIMRNRNAQLDEYEHLINAGILDSLGILKLVAFVEESFSIQVPDEDVVYENFHSLHSIVEYLQQR